MVKVEILNHERGEVVGTIDTDGNLKTESNALREVSQEYLEEGVPVLVPTTYENEDGETVHADAEVMIKPGTKGFLRAFVDELSSPFDCDLEVGAAGSRRRVAYRSIFPGYAIPEFETAHNQNTLFSERDLFSD